MEEKIVYTISQAQHDKEFADAIAEGVINPVISVARVITSTGATMAELLTRDVPSDAFLVRIIRVSELPADRLFRNAWDDSNPENFIGLDLAKAKVMAHGFRRADREGQLTPLDKESEFVSTDQARKDTIVLEKTAILNKV